MMYGMENHAGDELAVTVSENGTMVVPTPVERDEEIVLENTTYPFRMIENMSSEKRAELHIVEVLVDAVPDLHEFDVVENPPAKVDGVWKITYTSTPKDPGIADTISKELVDNTAETVRADFITPGAGQAMTYQRKLEEATSYQSNPNGSYPLLEASVGVDGNTVADVATTVIATSAAWGAMAAAIEAIRLHGKMRIGKGVSITTKRAVCNIAVTALEALPSAQDPSVTVSDALAAMAQLAP